MIKVVNLVHSFAKSFPAVNRMLSHRDGIDVLRNVMTSPQFSAVRALIVDDDSDEGFHVQDFNVDGLFDEFGDVEVSFINFRETTATILINYVVLRVICEMSLS